MRASHVGRYKDIGLLLVKHRHAVEDMDVGEIDDATLAEDGRSLACELEEMGPTFIKLGQLLSTRTDLLPPPYLVALSRLQEAVKPFSFADVEAVVSTELGVRMSNAFSSFESDPVAAASLGQVHRAALRDGRRVAVKVQRPGVRDEVLDDLEVIESMAAFADEHTDAGRHLGLSDMVAEFRRSLLDELDYRREATNLQQLGAQLARHERMVVPQPIPDYCSEHVLTMEYVDGKSIGAIGPLGLMDVDGPALAGALFSAYLDQILVHGMFHADPHPGNVLVTDDKRLALLDLGMVARVAPEMQDRLIRLLLAVSEGSASDAADVAITLGRKLDDFDPARFRAGATELLNRNRGAPLRDVNVGATVAELTRLAAGAGLRLPAELTMLGKTLLNLDEVARKLDPDFDPTAAIQREAAELMRKKLLQSASPGNLMAAAMDAKEFTEQLPGRINQILDALATGRMTVNVQGIDERDIMRSFQKLANRVTAGIVVASLVIGAALIMRIDTDAKLFGYPAVAIVMFLVAAGFSVWLLVSIQLSDLPQRKRGRLRRHSER